MFRCQLTTADEILEAYEEKLEFKDDKEIIIQNVSVVGLSDFAPKANPNAIRKAVEKCKISIQFISILSHLIFMLLIVNDHQL